MIVKGVTSEIWDPVQWGLVGVKMHYLVIWIWTLHWGLSANMVYGDLKSTDTDKKPEGTKHSHMTVIENLGHDMERT